MRMTLYGMYNYDPTLFDGFTLPDNADKSILIDTILSYSGDLYPYYQQPVWLKRNITNWFNSMAYNIQQSFTALKAEYNPIENYDRYESHSENRTTSDSEKMSAESNATSSNTDATNTNSSNNATNMVSAFNSTGFQNDSYNEGSGAGSSASEGSSKSDATNSQNTTREGSDSFTSEGRTHGNIGLTTNQQMILAEIQLRKYDLYVEIAKQFEERFIVQLY